MLDEKKGLDVRRSTFAVYCSYIERRKAWNTEFTNKHEGTQDIHS